MCPNILQACFVVLHDSNDRCMQYMQTPQRCNSNCQSQSYCMFVHATSVYSLFMPHDASAATNNKRHLPLIQVGYLDGNEWLLSQVLQIFISFLVWHFSIKSTGWASQLKLWSNLRSDLRSGRHKHNSLSDQGVNKPLIASLSSRL